MIAGTVPPGPASAIGRWGNGRFNWNFTVRSSVADNSLVAAIKALTNGTRTAFETRHPIDTAPPVGEKMLLPRD
jgi:hypothetical protein